MGARGRAMVLAALVAPLASLAQAASFDCDQAGLAPDEQLICDTRDLNDADVRMATKFRLLSGLFMMGTRHDMQDDQAAWLRGRMQCGADVACIRRAYRAREAELDAIYDSIDRPL